MINVMVAVFMGFLIGIGVGVYMQRSVDNRTCVSVFEPTMGMVTYCANSDRIKRITS